MCVLPRRTYKHTHTHDTQKDTASCSRRGCHLTIMCPQPHLQNNTNKPFGNALQYNNKPAQHGN